MASSNIWRYRAFEGVPSLFAPDLSHIHAAAASGRRRAETALLASIAVGETPLIQLHPAAVGAIVRALREVGEDHAGRLFADIECAEHAAYLHLSAPNGRGGDTSNNPLFRFHLPPDWVERYKYLKQTRFASRKAEESDVEWVMQGGNEMPLE